MEGIGVARSEEDGRFLVDGSDHLRPHGVDHEIKALDAVLPVPPCLGDLQEKRAVLRDEPQHLAVHARQPPRVREDRLGGNHLAREKTLLK